MTVLEGHGEFREHSGGNASFCASSISEKEKEGGEREGGKPPRVLYVGRSLRIVLLFLGKKEERAAPIVLAAEEFLRVEGEKRRKGGRGKGQWTTGKIR